jgi:hypothetical protein
MREKIEQAVFGLIAILGVLISILDLLGLFENVPFLANKITTITLLAVGLVMGYLTLERRSKLDNIEHLIVNGTEQVIRSLKGVDVQRFVDTQEMYRYVVKRMQEAKRTIDDLTWGPAERGTTQAAEEAVEKYVQTISVVCSKKTIAYREVMSFSVYDRFNHLQRAKTMLDKNLVGYRLRYYEFAKEGLPPLLLFMVIDSEEVILASCRAPFLPSEREIQLAIKHPDIVKLFQDYYDTIWQGAKVLKEGDRVEYATLEEIRKRLSQ